MRQFACLALSFLLVIALGQAAMGFGRFGATDLMNVPTSGTLAEGAYGLYASVADGQAVFGMDCGLLANLELGVAAAVGDGWETAGLRAKYHLLSEKRDGFGLAIGVQDVGQDTISPYIVAGKTLARGFMGYAGIGAGRIDGVFFGLSENPSSLPGASLFLEYDGDGINLGGRFSLANNLGLDIGLVGLDSLAVGVSFVGRF